MLSGVLRSDVAIAANIAIMRAFIRVREYLSAVSTVSAELSELRARVDLLRQQREDDLYLAIGELSSRIEEKKSGQKPRIGFK